MPEDLPHLLLECPTWAQQRALYLHPILRRCKVFTWLGKPERRADLTHILLGGTVEPHRALSLAHKDKAAKKKTFFCGAEKSREVEKLRETAYAEEGERGAHHDAAVAGWIEALVENKRTQAEAETQTS